LYTVQRLKELFTDITLFAQVLHFLFHRYVRLGVAWVVAVVVAWYTFYLGVPVLKKCPQDKAVLYTIVVVFCGIVLGIVLAGLLVSMVLGGAGMGAMGMYN